MGSSIKIIMLVPSFVTINLVKADCKKLKQQQKKKYKPQQRGTLKLVYKISNKQKYFQNI